MTRPYRTLALVPGVYVAEYADRIKLGISESLRGRLRAHGKAGATRARAWIAPHCNDWWWHVEDDALAAAAIVGHQIGNSESFTGLTFGQAIDIFRAVTTRHWSGPVHEIDGFTPDVVIPVANKWTAAHHGWDGSHLLEGAAR